jgi:hypothetical protein
MNGLKAFELKVASRMRARQKVKSGSAHFAAERSWLGNYMKGSACRALQTTPLPVFVAVFVAVAEAVAEVDGVRNRVDARLFLLHRQLYVVHEDHGVGLALFHTFHSRYFAAKHQSMTAGTVHVTADLYA